MLSGRSTRIGGVLESIKESLTRASYFLGLATAAITILNFIQHMRDNKIVAAQEKQLAESRELTKLYQQNISGITSLVGTLNSAVDFYQKAQASLKDVADLQARQQAQTDRWQNEVVEINRQAIELTLRCTRKAHNNLAVQRAVRDFRNRYEIVARGAIDSARFNANVDFLLGFNSRIENKYDEALGYLKRAMDVAEAHKAGTGTGYEALRDGNHYKQWLTKLQNVCSYHCAIIVYNLGNYDEAKRWFETALLYDPIDYQSLTYIPEVMFLGRLASFPTIEAEFQNAAAKISSVTPQQEQSFALTKQQLLSQLYMKFGNCYLAEVPDPGYQRYRDLAAAEMHMRRAYDLDPTSVLPKFSLAQVLHRQRIDDPLARQLFEEVFVQIRDQLSIITEAKILVMHYYILALCCSYGRIDGQHPSLYTMRVYELIPQLPVPERLRIFSPWSKNDLKVAEFLDEVQRFEASANSPIIKSTSPVMEPRGRKTTYGYRT